MFNKQNGITLVALVITIIVLLILAGVTITLALNGGIIDKSSEAAKSYNAAAVKEALEVAAATVTTKALADKADLTASSIISDLKAILKSPDYEEPTTQGDGTELDPIIFTHADSGISGSYVIGDNPRILEVTVAP